MGDMTRLLLLLWAGVSVSSAVDLQKRIIGGVNCNDAERGYHVYVEGFDGTHTYKCGGSLISKKWILTAAHCWERTMYVYLGVHPGQLKLQNGIRITEYEIYRDTNGYHDIMLLKLPDPTKIKPIKLPSDNECVSAPPSVQVAGYGATQMFPDKTRKNDRPDRLQCADIPDFDCKEKRECMKKQKDQTMYNEYHYQHWLCFKDSAKDTSPGDSGGGVVHNDKIYGVISFGPNTACTTGAVAMNICNHETMKWIKKIADLK